MDDLVIAQVTKCHHVSLKYSENVGRYFSQSSFLILDHTCSVHQLSGGGHLTPVLLLSNIVKLPIILSVFYLRCLFPALNSDPFFP